MEKIVIKIWRFIETSTACLMMLAAIPIARNLPFVGFTMMILSILLFNELIEEDKKKGGAR